VAAFLFVLDGLITAAALGAAVSAIVLVVGLLTGGESTPQQARDRHRRYRELLKRGRQSLWESPEDQELGSTIRNINLRQSQRRRVFLAARIRHPALPVSWPAQSSTSPTQGRGWRLATPWSCRERLSWRSARADSGFAPRLSGRRITPAGFASSPRRLRAP
jgi:hypothetical protein